MIFETAPRRALKGRLAIQQRVRDGAGVNTLLYLLYGTAEEFQLELTYSVLSAAARIGGGSREFRIPLASAANTRRADPPLAPPPFWSEDLHDWTLVGGFTSAADI